MSMRGSGIKSPHKMTKQELVARLLKVQLLRVDQNKQIDLVNTENTRLRRGLLFLIENAPNLTLDEFRQKGQELLHPNIDNFISPQSDFAINRRAIDRTMLR